MGHNSAGGSGSGSLPSAYLIARPSTRAPRRWTGTRHAIGSPLRVIVTSSPALTLRNSSDKVVFASCTPISTMTVILAKSSTKLAETGGAVGDVIVG